MCRLQNCKTWMALTCTSRWYFGPLNGKIILHWTTRTVQETRSRNNTDMTEIEVQCSLFSNNIWINIGESLLTNHNYFTGAWNSTIDKTVAVNRLRATTMIFSGFLHFHNHLKGNNSGKDVPDFRLLQLCVWKILHGFRVCKTQSFRWFGCAHYTPKCVWVLFGESSAFHTAFAQHLRHYWANSH